jgi:hypothetical protein
MWVAGSRSHAAAQCASHDEAAVLIHSYHGENIMKIQPDYALAAPTEPRNTAMMAGEFEESRVAKEASCCSKLLGCITSILCCPCICCLGCCATAALSYVAAKDPDAFEAATQNLFSPPPNGAPALD